MPELTGAQKSAIALRGEDMLVSAAAGSGKTFVLTRRIVTMIAQENADVRDMLLATFTNAAAAQMKKRLHDALSAAMNDENVDQQHLRQQLLYLNSADIGTLHAFCISIVRNYFYVLDVPCDFKIIDAAEDVLLRAEVLERVIEENYAKENNDDFLAFAEMYTTSRSIDKLHRVILEAYDYAMSRPEGLAWMKKEVDYYAQCSDVKHSKWLDILLLKAKEDIENAKAEMAYGIELGRAHLKESAMSVLQEEYENICTVAEALEEGFEAYQRAYEACLAPCGGSFRPGEKTEDVKEIIQARKRAKTIIKRDVKKIAQYPLEKATLENVVLSRVLNVLYETVLQFAEEYRRQKDRKRVITFNDSEHYCLAILSDAAIQKEVADRYAQIFIDEYQDISLLQEAILQRISREGNRFIVGDVKQSIYRFRLADATIFNEKYARYAKAKGDGALVVLNKNFRSSDGVIDFINAIFEQIMNMTTSGIDYDGNARLIRGREEHCGGAKAEVYVFEGGAEPTEEEASTLTLYQDAQMEALRTVQIIQEQLKTEIYDRKREVMRKAEYGDIVILLASPAIDAACYTDILTRHNIPVYYDAPRGYFDSLEVDLMLNLLKTIDNCKQDIALLAVLRAPFFDFSMEEIIRVKKSADRTFFYEAAEDYLEHKKNKLADKLNAFYAQIAEYKAYSKHVGVYDLLRRIYRETGYDEYVSLLVDGTLRKANLDQLLDVALRYEKSGGGGLFGFVQFVAKVREAQTEVATGTRFSQENAVRIMSIHKSKGLEFPIVILGRTSKHYNTDDVNRKEMIYHKDIGIGPEYVDIERGYHCNSIAKMAARYIVKNELAAESMRLLYVALSRAEEKIIITALINDIDKRKAVWRAGINNARILSMNTFIDCVLSAVYHTPDYTRICDVHYAVAPTSMERLAATHKHQFYEQLSQSDAQPDEQTVRKLSWQYPFIKSTQIAQRLTVSELKQREAVQPPRRYASFAGEENNRYDAQRYGVLTHYVLQTISLEALKHQKSREGYAAVIEEHLRKLQLEGVLSEAEAREMDVEKLCAFFASTAGQLMLDADRVRREVEFYYLLDADEVYEDVAFGEKVYLQGVVDCIVQKGKETVIIDYKTDRYGTDERREMLIAAYRRQLYYYKRAYEEITQTRVDKSLLCFINMKETIELNI